uniref:Odorant receptor n=1 Tax=Culicoides sonorensis TaxID=179676 RepID=A0A336LSA8_CULSO
MNYFDPIQEFYISLTSKIGYDWILGYESSSKSRQKSIFLLMVGFLFINHGQVTFALIRFDSFGVWAVCVILFSAASFSLIAAILLVIYAKKLQYILKWCNKIYINKINSAFVHLRSPILKKCAKQTEFFIKITRNSFNFILFVIFVTPIPLFIFTGRIMLPVTFSFPGLPYDELKYYMLNYFSQFFGVFCAAGVTTCLNAILVTVLLHTKYQLDFIDECIKETIDGAESDFGVKDVKEMLEDIIKMHADVLNTMKLASEAFSLQILLFDMVTYFVIGFTYVATQLDKSLIYFAIIAIVCASYLGLISFLGTNLHERSTSIATVIYCSKWYNLDVKHQQTLKLVMLRSQKSKPLTAGGFTELSLVSYIKLLYRSYSFCTLAQVMLNKKNI